MKTDDYNDYIFLTKKYLRNYNKFKLAAKVIENDIQSKEKILNESSDIAAAIAKYGGMTSAGHSELNTVEAACERRMNTAKEIESKKNDLVNIKNLLNKVELALLAVDYDTRKIVMDYYINGYSWEQISFRHYYSAKWCREKSKKAIGDMSVVIFGMKAQRPIQMEFVFAQ